MNETIERVSVSEFLANITKMVDEKFNQFNENKAKGKNYDGHHSVGTRYGLVAHLPHYQLIDYLSVHLDGYPKTSTILRELNKNVEFMKAQHYAADMLNFLNQRAQYEVEKHSELLHPVVIQSLKLRVTQGQVKLEMLLRCIGFLQFHQDAGNAVIELLMATGWKHHIHKSNLPYYVAYLPLAKDYCDQLVASINEDEKDIAYFNGTTSRIEKEFNELITGIFNWY